MGYFNECCLLFRYPFNKFLSQIIDFNTTVVTMYIDSHAHLTSEQFKDDREGVLQRAADAGVHIIINPGTDLDDSLQAVELAEKYSNVYACVGFHPHDAKKADEASLTRIEELCVHPKVVAVGEIGLDFHYDFSPRDVQEKVFRLQIKIAQRQNLPIVIHTRESNDETIAIVEEAVLSNRDWRISNGGRGVFHCFSGDVAMARTVIAMDFLVSVPGVVTFKNPGFATQVAAEISSDHLLLETDSPYLAPVPHRGKRNEPSNIHLIAETIASLRGVSPAEVARITTQNVYRLFGISPA